MSEAKQPLPPISRVRSAVESLLLVSDEPITATALARVISTDDMPIEPETVEAILTEIADEFDARGSGMELRQIQQPGDSTTTATTTGWRLFTRRENSSFVEAKVLDGAQQRLSRAALETLAVVAYRQPVTRAQVAAVRGVNCDAVMRTLALRGLIAEDNETTGNGGALLYNTTDLFLEQLGLESLAQLPDLAPLLPEVEDIDE